MVAECHSVFPTAWPTPHLTIRPTDGMLAVWVVMLVMNPGPSFTMASVIINDTEVRPGRIRGASGAVAAGEETDEQVHNQNGLGYVADPSAAATDAMNDEILSTAASTMAMGMTGGHRGPDGP